MWPYYCTCRIWLIGLTVVRAAVFHGKDDCVWSAWDSPLPVKASTAPGEGLSSACPQTTGKGLHEHMQLEWQGREGEGRGEEGRG